MYVCTYIQGQSYAYHYMLEKLTEHEKEAFKIKHNLRDTPTRNGIKNYCSKLGLIIDSIDTNI